MYELWEYLQWTDLTYQLEERSCRLDNASNSMNTSRVMIERAEKPLTYLRYNDDSHTSYKSSIFCWPFHDRAQKGIGLRQQEKRMIGMKLRNSSG